MKDNSYDWNPINRKKFNDSSPWWQNRILWVIGGVLVVVLVIGGVAIASSKKKDDKKPSTSTQSQSSSSDSSNKASGSTNKSDSSDSSKTDTSKTDTKSTTDSSTSTTATQPPTPATAAEDQAAINTLMSATYTGGASNKNTCDLVPKSYSYNLNDLKTGSASATIVTQNTNGATKTINAVLTKSATNWSIQSVTCS